MGRRRCHVGVHDRNQGWGKSPGLHVVLRLIAPAIQLILDNPPVGERGRAVAVDGDKSWQEMFSSGFSFNVYLLIFILIHPQTEWRLFFYNRSSVACHCFLTTPHHHWTLLLHYFLPSACLSVWIRFDDISCFWFKNSHPLFAQVVSWSPPPPPRLPLHESVAQHSAYFCKFLSHEVFAGIASPPSWCKSVISCDGRHQQ